MLRSRDIAELTLDPAREAKARQLLTDHFRHQGYFDVASSVEHSLSIAAADERFTYLLSKLPEGYFAARRSLLVSGMSAGSELLAGRRAGFEIAYGTEVDPFYIELCSERLGSIPGLVFQHYAGGELPYKAETFDVVVSGHIIEHTESPSFYLTEHLRVLKTGGLFYLEYPTRYHHHELHTGLWSAEWLPTPVRNAVLRAIGSKRSPFSAESRRKCRVILETSLKQISLLQIHRWIAGSGFRAIRVHSYKCSPGVVRVIFRVLGFRRARASRIGG